MTMPWLSKFFSTSSTNLDTILFPWPDSSPFRVEDALRHVGIWGKTGSGKTSGSGRKLSTALLSLPGSGGMVFCSKPEEKDTWVNLAKSVGRLDDLIVFNPESDWRFNTIDFLGSDSTEVTTLILVAEEALARMQNRGGERFWENEKKRALWNAAEVIRLAHGRVTAHELSRFILDAAISLDQLKDPKWQQGYHYLTFRKADVAQKSAVERHNFELCARFWTKEWPAMADKQRSGVISETQSVLHVYISGITRELIGTSTNCSPADMAKGKWIIVDLNPKLETGRFILAAFKYAAQRWILNRKVGPGDNFTFLWADEYQNLANKPDAHFLAEARSHNAGMVLLTQAYSSLLAGMAGDGGKAYVDALLSNVATMVMHQLDHESADFASKMLGMQREVFINVSPGKPESAYDRVAGNLDYSPSYNESYQPVLQSRVFMNNMRTGGKSNNYTVDGIVISSNEFRGTGERYLKVAFKQR